jgi:hypothetical protein
VHHDSIPKRDSGIECRARVDAAILPNVDPLANHGSGFNPGSRANRRVIADKCAGPNRDVCSKLGIDTKNGCGMDSSGWRGGIQKLSGASKPKPRLGSFDDRFRLQRRRGCSILGSSFIAAKGGKA